MKYKIGDRVILFRDKNIMNRYIIIATENQMLNKAYLKSLRVELTIKNIEKFAESEVKITHGFRYKICKCSDDYNEGRCILEGEFIDIMDDDELWR